MSSKVVKFIVKVKLVEKRVNSHVGSVMLVKVISQYRLPGSNLIIKRVRRARRLKIEPSKEVLCNSCSIEAVAFWIKEGDSRAVFKGSDAIVRTHELLQLADISPSCPAVP